MPLLSEAGLKNSPVQVPPVSGIQPIDPSIQSSGFNDKTAGLQDPSIQVPPTRDIPADVGPTNVIDPVGTTLQDLYPTQPDAITPNTPTVATPGGAGVTAADVSVAEVGTPGVAGATTVGQVASADVTQNDQSVGAVGTPGSAQANTGVLANAANATAAQSDLTSEQQVDAELARILGQDSPLLARARAEAAQLSNSRGLQNTSMASGAAFGALADRATPLAQQNASQGFQRALANAGFRQEASIFNADQQNRFTALEAQLGTDVSMFNADQLNQAEKLSAQLQTAMEQQDTDAANRVSLQLAELKRDAQAQQAQIAFDTGVFNADQQNQAEQLSAQMRTAIEQGNADAANRASLQLADLLRNAEAQQSDIDFAANQQGADAQNALNQQMMSQITALNEQYLRGSQAMDLATIQGTYQQLISTNATAANLYQSFFDGIGAVMAQPDMTPSQIAQAVATQQSMLEAALNMIETINGIDFGDVGVPGAAPVPGGPIGPVPNFGSNFG